MPQTTRELPRLDVRLLRATGSLTDNPLPHHFKPPVRAPWPAGPGWAVVIVCVCILIILSNHRSPF